MDTKTSLDETLPTYEQAIIHSLSTTSANLEVPSAPPEEPSTSPDLSLPTYEQARLLSLSTLSAKAEASSEPPEYEEVDTTSSRRIIETTESFLSQLRFCDQRTYEMQTTFPEPPVAIIEHPTPIP